MSRKELPQEIAASDSRALKAWRELRPEPVQPGRIERLKGDKETSRKSAYRLAGVGPDGSTIIAKRCGRAKALIERTIYEKVLPRLPIPALRYYGCAEETDGDFCWLFLEDAGEARYSPFTDEHRRVAARWLGLLHTSAARLGPSAGLPDQGPSYYLERLQSARERTLGGLGNPAVSAEDRGVLQGVLAQLEVLESRWPEVETLYEGMPRTVVHGDFKEKNIRLRTGEAETLCLPFDWGDAGWGAPVIDLAQSPVPFRGFAGNPDMATYFEVVRDHWPTLDLASVRQWANVATLLRAVLAINWDASSLAYPWVKKPMVRIGLYRTALDHGMQATGWAH